MDNFNDTIAKFKFYLNSDKLAVSGLISIFFTASQKLKAIVLKKKHHIVCSKQRKLPAKGHYLILVNFDYTGYYFTMFYHIT